MGGFCGFFGGGGSGGFCILIWLFFWNWGNKIGLGDWGLPSGAYPLSLNAYGRLVSCGQGSALSFRVSSYAKTVLFKTNPRARMG